ncbi:MAG: prepilin-type N-terminal cleavage/methylation domain-containing protein [Betaproteobacteria bacterium]|nr:prepilin-type N-terminal cleavage/methylation domain-containing protein [Betaproteobacteria bacterium]
MKWKIAIHAAPDYSSRPAGGFSLLELLLVVAVGAVLILAGLGAYRLVSENNNTNQATRLLATLKQQVQQAYQGQASYGTGNLVDDLTALRALPTDLGTSGTGNTMVAKAMFGPITITGNNTTFSIGLTNVPKGACVRLGQQFTPQNANDFVSLQVATQSYNQASSITQTALLASCNNQAASNTMTWTFQ